MDPISVNLAKIGLPGTTGPGAAGAGSAASSPGAAGQTSFSDILKQSIDEVSKLQQDATQAVNDVATGQTQDMSGVMTAVEKADMAFRTLLTIRGKLMDAYDEIKGLSV